MSQNKRKPFFTTPAFTKGSAEMEKERQGRLGIVPETKTETSLAERVEASDEIKSQAQESSLETISTNPDTHKPERQYKREKGKNQRIRFANTLDQYVPAKYIKSGTISTVKAHEKILTQFKMLSIEKKMSVEDLFNIAAFSFLVETKYIKDELIKPFDL